MKIRVMTRSQFEYFKACGRMQWKWWRWPLTLSCNASRAVWPPSGYGVTPIERREYLDGHLALLDEVVADVLRERAGGGRFHINNTGAFLATDGRQVTAFVLT